VVERTDDQTDSERRGGTPLGDSPPSPAGRLTRRSRPHRIYHKRWCSEHDQHEVCLCTKGADHHSRSTTVSKSQQAQARWSERVNRAHRAAWVHARNVHAWTRVYGRVGAGAHAFVGTYASAAYEGADTLSASCESLDGPSLDELGLLDPLDELRF
jgi:hypothetical protein